MRSGVFEMFSLLSQKKKDITDTAETVEISSLALLKMLKHGMTFWRVIVGVAVIVVLITLSLPKVELVFRLKLWVLCLASLLTISLWKLSMCFRCPKMVRVSASRRSMKSFSKGCSNAWSKPGEPSLLLGGITAIQGSAAGFQESTKKCRTLLKSSTLYFQFVYPHDRYFVKFFSLSFYNFFVIYELFMFVPIILLVTRLYWYFFLCACVNRCNSSG